MVEKREVKKIQNRHCLIRNRLRHIEEVLDGFFGRTNQNPVSEVQHVSSRTRLAAHILDSLFDGIFAGEQHHGIDVALHRLIPDASATILHVNRPIQANRVHSQRGHALQKPARTVGVERNRRPRVRLLHLANDAVNVRLRPLLPHVRRELTTPRIKHLNHLRAGIDLEPNVHGQGIRYGGQQRVQHIRVVEAHRLDGFIRRRRLSFDNVRAQRPRRTDKPEHCGIVTNLLSQNLQRLRHKLHLAQVHFV
mmetsp:Transcript_6526/g.21417  ORF Transcript_6526/g.21417 Transcript_6526/m.21417 type:complete len:250 (+) Transcript_6526:1227-1976(+)